MLAIDRCFLEMFAINFWFCRGVSLRSAKPPMGEDEILTLREVGDYREADRANPLPVDAEAQVAGAQSGELLALPDAGY